MEKDPVEEQDPVEEHVNRGNMEHDPVEERVDQGKMEHNPMEEQMDQEKIEQDPVKERVDPEKIEQDPVKEHVDRENMEDVSVEERVDQEKLQDPVEEQGDQGKMEHDPMEKGPDTQGEADYGADFEDSDQEGERDGRRIYGVKDTEDHERSRDNLENENLAEGIRHTEDVMETSEDLKDIEPATQANVNQEADKEEDGEDERGETEENWDDREEPKKSLAQSERKSYANSNQESEKEPKKSVTQSEGRSYANSNQESEKEPKKSVAQSERKSRAKSNQENENAQDEPSKAANKSTKPKKAKQEGEKKEKKKRKRKEKEEKKEHEAKPPTKQLYVSPHLTEPPAWKKMVIEDFFYPGAMGRPSLLQRVKHPAENASDRTSELATPKSLPAEFHPNYAATIDMAPTWGGKYKDWFRPKELAVNHINFEDSEPAD